MRLAASTVKPVVRSIEWLFGPGVPGVNVCMGLFALIWAVLMVVQPATFDTGRFVGMQWLPDRAWIAFFAVLALLHGIALFPAGQTHVRKVADLASAWVWISVAGSFLRVEMRTAEVSPGTLIYVVMGFAALAHAIYCAGQPRAGG